MMQNLYNFQVSAENCWWILPVLIWSIVWKGLALWRAAKLGQKPWFVALLVINTVGILEILYLYFFSKKTKSI
jgi:hypothetical protein